jgi:hypothetical protein
MQDFGSRSSPTARLGATHRSQILCTSIKEYGLDSRAADEIPLRRLNLKGGTAADIYSALRIH